MYVIYNLSISFMFMHLYYQYFNIYVEKLNIERVKDQSEALIGHKTVSSEKIDLSEYQNGPNLLTIKVSANLFFSFYLAIFI